MHFMIALLVVASIIEAWQTIGDVVHTARNINAILLAGALATGLMPAAAVIFWGGKAILVQLETPFRSIRRYIGNLREQKRSRQSDD
jgi:hypothetical protein